MVVHLDSLASILTKPLWMRLAVAEKNSGKAYKFYLTQHMDIEVKYKLTVLKEKQLLVLVRLYHKIRPKDLEQVAGRSSFSLIIKPS